MIWENTSKQYCRYGSVIDLVMSIDVDKVDEEAAPELCLWKELENQGFTPGQVHVLMPVDTGTDTLQRSIVLISNASNYV